ncbi:pilin [Actinomadura sp. SCN-SB]|uniref:pilin n=1 Tax=Actinomadura sp. SCN-SB TaxID=3373092 RepID=UPI0037521E5F
MTRPLDTARALDAARAMAAVVLRAVAVAALIASTVVAGAAEALAEPPQDLNTVINNITRWLVGLLASLATLFLTVGGIRYLLAGGDPGEVAKAKDTLKYAAIGYGIAVLAPVLVNILKGFVGG